MSFEELIKLKEELGLKSYNEAVFGENSSERKPKAKTKFVRENKNRPREISAKKQVPLLGKATTSKSAERCRDPRYDEKCGEFDRDQFKANYSFVNDIRESELVELKKQLRALGKNQSEEKEKIKLLIQRMQNQNREEEKLQARKKAKAEDREKNSKAIKSEKRPFFISKGSYSVAIYSIWVFFISSVFANCFLCR